ncbi:MAG: PEP-CTERM sorting domain-containing protein [Sphingomonadales bacterium]|nr:PEP-CTERM sorting domain-containing protein [Sphingomonadales bacterium]
MFRNWIVSSASALAGALLLFSANASATILPLDQCGTVACDWSGVTITPDPTTGDVWIKFESTQGAGDKGHIEAISREFWEVTVGSNPVIAPSIHDVFDDPFLTDMDQPIPPTLALIGPEQLPGFLHFTVEFLGPVFVHDIHIPCNTQSFSPIDCIDFFANTGAGLTIFSNRDIVTGIWEMDVPTPGTLALFGLGLAGLGAMRRRVRG